MTNARRAASSSYLKSRTAWSNSKAFFEKEFRLKMELEQKMKELGLECKIESRRKTIASMRAKIERKNILPEQITDTIGLRIITRRKEECYAAMGKVLSHWNVSSHKIKDFIAIPKSNGYQSIHVSFYCGKYPVEIQIRSLRMHREAQFGKASHRNYKR